MPGTDVYILGQKYTIKGDAPEKHIQKLAEDINRNVKEVCAKFPNIAPTQALILTMFNMAEQIHRLTDEQEDLAKGIREKADILAGLLD
jgi:cell division protein ZapA